MSELFYRAFEDKFRGPRELIKSRLTIYLPFIQPLFKELPMGKALDLGCGRGEWLELLKEHGHNAFGVDSDDGMLKACRERGLNVETGDALAYLKTLPQGSLCVISGFHIAEHLPFDVLQQLVVEAKRVLTPGGLLILETPNPENISVGTSSFYLDPTHLRPIPSALLCFLPEYYGFQRFKVLPLNENQDLRSRRNLRLIDVVNGVSPDYAVIAQTACDSMLTDALQPAFDKEYGITLHDLAEQYEQNLMQRYRQELKAKIEAVVQQSETDKNWSITKIFHRGRSHWRQLRKLWTK